MDMIDRTIRFAGGSQGVLLIHGLGGTPVEMRYVAQGLARAGYTVHVPQLAGHCATAEDLWATTWQHWYESVEEEHYRLRECCSTIVVGGLSMGAILALHHAVPYSADVPALAIHAPTHSLENCAKPSHSSLSKLL